jgi:hypothetical protein
MVYELTRKTTPDSKRHFLKCKWLYKILATNIMLYILYGGIQPSQLCRFCCEEIQSWDNIFWYCPALPRVCKAVIKAKDGYFEASKIYFDMFNTFWLLRHSICVIS